MSSTATKVAIVMYHYVRPIATSRYPRIKGLELEAFEAQLDYLDRFFTPVSFEQLIASLRGGPPLPQRAVMLTFDDGYRDHIDHVLPALLRRGYSGAFFPTGIGAFEQRMLDVNKIQFVLAAGTDAATLATTLDGLIAGFASQYDLETVDVYRSRHRQADHLDDADTVYVKHMLQYVLPEAPRRTIADELFRRFVSTDPTGFAGDLYMGKSDLLRLREAGMHVGSHGHHHIWLGQSTLEAQRADIRESVRLLRDAGIVEREFTLCYPYGSFVDDTIAIARDEGCVAAVTVEQGIAEIHDHTDPMRLPRLDTIDLPRAGDAPPNVWVRRCLSDSDA